MDVFTTKVQLVFDRVLAAYGDNADSAYDATPDHQFSHLAKVEFDGPLNANRIAEDVVQRIHADPDLAAHVAHQLSAETEPKRPG